MTSYPTLSPHLAVADAAAAIDFYVGVLGAAEVQRFTLPDGQIPHCEMLFGDALVTLGTAMAEYEQAAPTVDGPVQGALTYLVADVDAMFAAAVGRGAQPGSEPADGPFGMRTATLRDPFGHRWILARVLREVPVAEQQSAFRKMVGIE